MQVFSKQMAAFDRSGGEFSSVGIFTDATSAIHTSAYGPGGAAVAIAILLFLSSRRLGSWIAQGL